MNYCTKLNEYNYNCKIEKLSSVLGYSLAVIFDVGGSSAIWLSSELADSSQTAVEPLEKLTANTPGVPGFHRKLCRLLP